jgi:hypothetical protein
MAAICAFRPAGVAGYQPLTGQQGLSRCQPDIAGRGGGRRSASGGEIVKGSCPGSSERDRAGADAHGHGPRGQHEQAFEKHAAEINERRRLEDADAENSARREHTGAERDDDEQQPDQSRECSPVITKKWSQRWSIAVLETDSFAMMQLRVLGGARQRAPTS